MKAGQKVVRINGSLQGSLEVGDVVTVKCVVDEEYVELEGFDGCQFLRSQFLPLKDYTGENRHMSDLEQLEASLSFLDHWNRTHPTSQMISVEACNAQDGGSLFVTHGFDSNNIGELMGHLVRTASNEEKAAMLERAAQALRFGA